MAIHSSILQVAIALAGLNLLAGLYKAQAEDVLPPGVKAVWDPAKAYRETTPTRERICLNGLWCWQPAKNGATTPPQDGWGYFKVPGSWPGHGDYMQKDCQTVYAHSSWKAANLGALTTVWYQREIAVPAEWAGRRIALSAEYLNSIAEVFVDGRKIENMRFPAGELDLTSACRPGQKHTLSMLVTAVPVNAVMLSYSDTNAAKEVKGSVRHRGLCGDVYLAGTPSGARIGDVKIDTSVRKGELTTDAALQSLDAAAPYSLRAAITESDGKSVAEFTSKPFGAGDLKDGRISFTEKWKPGKLWDVHTPGNQYFLRLSLLGADGKVLDTFAPVRFGFREFWIEGRNFYLNGTRLFLSSVPIDNAINGAAWASYEGAKESMLRLRTFGMNFLYTHNYSCEPGDHLSFEEILRAADDVGMLISLTQPHAGATQYNWTAPDADEKNGYAKHAEFYVRVAQNHPSVVCYSTSHNACGYAEDMNPDLIDGINDKRSQWGLNNMKKAVRAEAIIKRLDPARIVYHHASGNLGSIHKAISIRTGLRFRNCPTGSNTGPPRA